MVTETQSGKRVQIRKTAKRREPEPLDLRTPSGKKLPY